MSTVRQQIIDAFVTRLQTISLGDSVTVLGASYTYQSNLGARVFKERQQPVQFSELPCLTVEPGSVSTDPERSEIGRPFRTLPVAVVIYCSGVPGATSDKYLQDLIKCIGSDPEWGGLVRWTSVEVGDAEVSQEDKTYHALPVQCEVTWRSATLYDL